MELGNTLQNFAVLQRNSVNVSEHPFYGGSKNNGDVLMTVKNADGAIVNGLEKVAAGTAQGGKVNGVIKGLPTGGPYTITLQIAKTSEKVVFKDVLVGDLWLLAGQSNMADYGELPSLSEPDPMVHAYYMVNKWDIAQDPLHDTRRAVAPVHGGSPENLPKTAGGRGAGPGLAFALAMYKTTNIPQGVIACAHGGTTLQQWDPALKKQGGNSLYGAMYERLQELGGKVAGALWYQGCSDAGSDDKVDQYSVRTRKLFNAIRRDCNNADLPIVLVQLGAFVANPGDVNISQKRWLRVRCEQYKLSLKMKNTACVPAIDLDLSDQIHLSNRGVAILGQRLAYAMQSLREPEKYLPPIRVKSLRCTTDVATANAKVEITFDNVCGALHANGGNPCGFSLTKDGEYISDAINCRLNGNRATVLLKMPALFFNESYQVAYGGNLQPHANIVDQAGRSLPCFTMGGKKKPDNMTAFVTDALVSTASYGSEELADLNLPGDAEWDKLNFSRATFSNVYLLCPPPEPGTDAKAPRKYYFCWQIELPEAMELKVMFGSDAPFALYCNRKELMRHFTTNPVVLDEFTDKLKLSAGRHKFTAVFASHGNRGWGICCRYVRLDGKFAPAVVPVDELE